MFVSDAGVVTKSACEGSDASAAKGAVEEMLLSFLISSRFDTWL